MLRIGVSTLHWTWSMLFALNACGGRTAETEQSIQATGGTLGGSAARNDFQTSVGGRSVTLAPLQSAGQQSLGGNPFVATTLTGGMHGAGGVPTNIGEATLSAVGGSLCALSYNGTTYTSLVSQELCGDGILEYSNGEQCDDGNQTSGDGCSNKCRFEANYPCGDGCRPCVRTIGCGDG